MLQLLILKYWYIPHLGINHISSRNQLPNMFKTPCFISNWSSYLINLVPDHYWEKGLCQNLFFFLNNEFINLFVNIISLTISCYFPFNFIPEKMKILTFLNLFLFQELSKITMPVVFNEPISFLQRITEYMEYSELLENACLCNDPVDRLKARRLDH